MLNFVYLEIQRILTSKCYSLEAEWHVWHVNHTSSCHNRTETELGSLCVSVPYHARRHHASGRHHRIGRIVGNLRNGAHKHLFLHKTSWLFTFLFFVLLFLFSVLYDIVDLLCELEIANHALCTLVTYSLTTCMR